jgi:thymidine phosphorylase
MSQFVTVDVIGKKRDKKELTTEEIKFVVDGFTSGAIADYQMSALLMAIVVNCILQFVVHYSIFSD